MLSIVYLATTKGSQEANNSLRDEGKDLKTDAYLLETSLSDVPYISK